MICLLWLQKIQKRVEFSDVSVSLPVCLPVRPSSLPARLRIRGTKLCRGLVLINVPLHDQNRLIEVVHLVSPPPATQTGSYRGGAPQRFEGGGKCKICAGLIDEDDCQSQEHIEKSTRVILGLLSHYSDTLMAVMKKGAAARQPMEKNATELKGPLDSEEDLKSGPGSISRIRA